MWQNETKNKAVKKKPLVQNIEQSIQFLMDAGVGWKYEGHKTTLETNDLEIIKGLLIHLKEKVG